MQKIKCVNVRFLIVIFITVNIFLWAGIKIGHKGLIFIEDYDNGTISKDWDTYGLCCQHSFQLVTSPVRSGRYAARFEVKFSDPNRYNGKRAEIVRWKKDVGKILGPDEWYGFSIYLPDDFVPAEGEDIVFQWHAQPDKGERPRAPSLSVRTENGKWKVIVSSSKDTMEKITNGYDLKKIWESNFQTGVWTDWVFHIKWDYRPVKYGGKGFVQIWHRVNGNKWEQVADYKGPDSYNDSWNVRFQWGSYRPEWKDCDPEEKLEECSNVKFTSRVVYNDELRIADSGPYIKRFNLVAPK